MADKPICKIPGCGKTAQTREWCTAHYKRWRRHGNPLSGTTPQGAPLAFLESALLMYTDACILWPYTKNDAGYGQVWCDGQLKRASRVVLERKLGRPMVSGTHAAHAPGICHNPACINPRHLREASIADNMADRLLDGTSNRGSRHGLSKLTEDDVISIRSDPRTQRVIASEFGLDQSTISDIKRRKSWSWL